VINVDAAVAWLVLIILFGTLFGIIWWTKDAPPYDDGVGGQWADYLPEPLEDEGWAEPPPPTKPPWERDVAPSSEADAGDVVATPGDEPAGPGVTAEAEGRDRPEGA
jgi:hypothetical protein